LETKVHLKCATEEKRTTARKFSELGGTMTPWIIARSSVPSFFVFVHPTVRAYGFDTLKKAMPMVKPSRNFFFPRARMHILHVMMKHNVGALTPIDGRKENPRNICLVMVGDNLMGVERKYSNRVERKSSIRFYREIANLDRRPNTRSRMPIRRPK
jgi:hypothetical protein